MNTNTFTKTGMNASQHSVTAQGNSLKGTLAKLEVSIDCERGRLNTLLMMIIGLRPQHPRRHFLQQARGSNAPLRKRAARKRPQSQVHWGAQDPPNRGWQVRATACAKFWFVELRMSWEDNWDNKRSKTWSCRTKSAESSRRRPSFNRT